MPGYGSQSYGGADRAAAVDQRSPRPELRRDHGSKRASPTILRALSDESDQQDCPRRR